MNIFSLPFLVKFTMQISIILLLLFFNPPQKRKTWIYWFFKSQLHFANGHFIKFANNTWKRPRGCSRVLIHSTGLYCGFEGGLALHLWGVWACWQASQWCQVQAGNSGAGSGTSFPPPEYEHFLPVCPPESTGACERAQGPAYKWWVAMEICIFRYWNME